MASAVKRPYDNSRRLAQARATRLDVIQAAKSLFIERGYPGTTLEAVAVAAGVALPTLYRLFGSKRALLKAVLDTSFGGDDEPIAFGDRPEQQQAKAESDPAAVVRAFARICRLFMERSAEMFHVLSSAAQVDPDIAELQNEIRRQRHAGQSRIAAAIAARDALDPELSLADAQDITYAALSPEVHRILTIERGWTSDQYERWLTRVLNSLLRPQPDRHPRSPPHSADQ
ncbi:MAG TPA: TetR/AcrR family transcriptional regulator [Streptosporangiaceae bacterium]|nr:TetR/AcrR family transcriptional regulator [Streptosporangiaceae bacterium]